MSPVPIIGVLAACRASQRDGDRPHGDRPHGDRRRRDDKGQDAEGDLGCAGTVFGREVQGEDGGVLRRVVDRDVAAVTKPTAQPPEGSRTVAGPGAESRRAPPTRSSHSGVGRFTIRTFHSRSGGYWTTTTPPGR